MVLFWLFGPKEVLIWHTIGPSQFAFIEFNDNDEDLNIRVPVVFANCTNLAQL
eukprot:COSAG02_NODE_1401_length_12832_cov_20.599702_10_plen_53_part_00